MPATAKNPTEPLCVWPPRLGGPTDAQLQADAWRAGKRDGARAAFSMLAEHWFECYSIDPQQGYELVWVYTHAAKIVEYDPPKAEAKLWQQLEYNEPVSDVGIIANSSRGIVLRRDDGGEWLLAGAANVPQGERVAVTGTRTGIDVLSNADISPVRN